MQETQVQSLGQEDALEKEMPTHFLQYSCLGNPIFLPGETHAQRSLVGYNPWGCKESDTTQRLNNSHVNQDVTPTKSDKESS